MRHKRFRLKMTAGTLQASAIASSYDCGRFLGLVGGLSRGGGGGAAGGLVSARPPARSRHAQAFVWLGTAGVGAGRGGICLLDRRGQGPADGARVRGRLHHRGLAQHRQSFCVPGAVSGVPDQPAAPAQSADVGRVGRVRAAGRVHRGGHHAAAALRVGHVDLRPVSALCGVAAGARRLGARGDSGVDRAPAAGRRVRCCR